ncbi:MAG: tautomerase family protein [Bacteroidota bacterium]
MPLVRIDILSGKTKEYKIALMNSIHQALIAAFKIPEDDKRQIIEEHDPEYFTIRSTNTDQYTLIQITIFKGRSLEAKKLLYQRIVENLKQNPGINPMDVTIVLNEQPLENWGIRGGKPASETELGFDVNV